VKRALLVLALVACERDRGVHVHIPPEHLGSRSTFHLRWDGQLTSPDGAVHGMHQELGLVIEVASMGPDGHAERLRVTVDRHDDVVDGTPKPTLSGTYEVTRDGTAMRADGKPLAPHEQAFFREWHVGTDDTTALQHEFRAGETYRPTPAEAQTFALPPSKQPFVLTVRRATDAEIVLAGEYEPVDAPVNVEAHGKLVVTLTPQGHSRVGDLTFRSQGNDVGALHATTELRRQR